MHARTPYQKDLMFAEVADKKDDYKSSTSESAGALRWASTMIPRFTSRCRIPSLAHLQSGDEQISL